MANRLILVGGGALARELMNWADDQGLVIDGFLDDNSDVLRGYSYQAEYLGGVSGFLPQPEDSFLMGISDPFIKKRVFKALKQKGAQFASFIHRSAIIAKNAKLGEGVIVCPQALISADAVIGDMVAINCCASIGHDVVVGPFCTLSAHVDLTGWVEIDECVFFGSGARVLPKVKVQSGARIGAGAVILRSVSKDAVMYAQPAKKL